MKSLLQLLNSNSAKGVDLGLLVLRLAGGLFMFYGHGMGKLGKIFSGAEIKFADPLGIGAVPSIYMAGFAEGICALLLTAGLLSRAASLVMAGNFVVVWYFHSVVLGESFGDFELPLLYLFCYVALTLAGPGKYSLDALLFKRNAV